MAITPDTKNWTWVLERVCPECGFDAKTFPREQVGSMIREVADSWREVLNQPDAARRPSPDVWSPLEYACHVRDVFRIFGDRLDFMLTTDSPQFANWDQDETAISERYAEQEPQAVGDDLSANASTIAVAFDSVAGGQWDRSGDRSDGSRFTVESLARYLIHDPIHHLHDVASAGPHAS